MKKNEETWIMLEYRFEYSFKPPPCPLLFEFIGNFENWWKEQRVNCKKKSFNVFSDIEFEWPSECVLTPEVIVRKSSQWRMSTSTSCPRRRRGTWTTASRGHRAPTPTTRRRWRGRKKSQWRTPTSAPCPRRWRETWTTASRGHQATWIPTEIRLVLIQANITDCRALALSSDQLFKPSVHATYAVRKSHASTKKFAIQTTQPKNERSDQADQQPTFCYFHQTYGSRARQCRSPCTFTSGNGQAGRQ